MEMSVYLTLARVSEYNLRAGGVTVALCNRIEDTFVSADRIAEYETRCIETGLRAVEILYRTNTNS
jgi:uridine phosphorylase